MRLVLDTNVVLSGLLWRSHPRRLLDLAREGTVSLFTSGVLLDELADVLSREKWATMLAARQTSAAFLMQTHPGGGRSQTREQRRSRRVWVAGVQRPFLPPLSKSATLAR